MTGTVFTDAAGRLTLAAGALLVAALAVASGGADRAAVALALAGAGTILALFVLVPRAARHARGTLVVAAVAGLAVLLLAAVTLGVAPSSGWIEVIGALIPLAVVGLAAAGGLVLVGDDLRRRLDLRARTPWQPLSGTGAGPGAGAPGPWRAAAGVVLVLFAAIVGFAYLSVLSGGVV